MTAAIAWSEAEISFVSTAWKNGLSASQIALNLVKKGFASRSRNAVIGKIHRLGFCGRVTPTRSFTPAKRPRRSSKGRVVIFKQAKQERPRKPTTGEMALYRALDPIGGALEEALPNQCRYIRDEPGSAICGRTATGSWCADHRKLVFECVKVEAAEMAAAA